MKRCPICKCELKVRDYSDNEMNEYYATCEEGCKNYNYEEWRDEHRTDLSNTVLGGNWNESNTAFKKRMFIYNKKLNRLRKAYKKRKLK